ncbi:MAG: rod shape-determining protein MreC [Elusimicrobia bacterium]|nr:rod shape-determining protein MreC [Elusimicrobiota bacterium]
MILPSRKTENVVLFGLIAICAVFLSLPTARWVQAIKSFGFYCLSYGPFLGARTFEQMDGIPENVRQLLRAREENEELRAKLREGKWLQQQLQALRLENERLREIFQLRGSLRWSWILARVQGREASEWFRSFLVDRGERDGVSVNDVVLGEWEGRVGLVGRVVEVAPRVSKVLLITDALSAAAAHLSRNKEQGLVEGKDLERLSFNYLSETADIRPADEVVTSGISQVFPPFIPIGSVRRVLPPDPDLRYRSAVLTPIVPPSRLREVLILRHIAPGDDAVR